jgi:uncharacterized protein (DUF2252 family)
MTVPQADIDYFTILSRQAKLPMLEGFTASWPTREESLYMGKQLRQKTPRKDHAKYVPAKNRRDPMDILNEQNRTRVQKLVPVRNARMRASTFGFYRGSAAVMAADLAGTPDSGLRVAACGDMHVANFGIFASAERNLIFAINDFDEVYPGPWEWDLKRLAASAVVAARFMGGDDVAGEEAARQAVSSYRKRIRRYAEMGFLDVWYDQINERTILDAAPARLRDSVEKLMQRARAKGHLRTLDKMTEKVDGAPRIVEDIPLIVRETTLEDGTPVNIALDMMLQAYIASLPDDRKRLLSRYRIVDSARKVVGVGSVGTGCWVLMLEGATADDPLFLQVKQAMPSVLSPYVTTKLTIDNQGKRVVTGQRLIQGSPDIFLGWGSFKDSFFYVRQLADMKGGVDFVEGDKKGLNGFSEYCRLCGWALALAHAKSGDPALIAGYCGNSEVLDEAIGKFALRYADQAAQDHERMVAAAKSSQPAGEAAVA